MGEQYAHRIGIFMQTWCQQKIPNPKHQITNKSQIPIFNNQNTKDVWSAGGGLVIVICDLEFLILQYFSTTEQLAILDILGVLFDQGLQKLTIIY